ncbi:MAG: beta(1,3)galactosyltransferase EpsH [Lachnospiraceae bacterium]|nr:beta(1,3)galactosyltransferase EpsH [Lachnospiraceae bacterium]
MIFVTVGSQKFPFDRLIQKVDQMIRKGLIHEVFMQTGTSRYVPGCPHQAFCEQERFDELMETCDLLITHGGAGTMVDAVKRGKRAVVVPRLARYGEHVDDHQMELAMQFQEMNLLCACPDVEQLPEVLSKIRGCRFDAFRSNRSTFQTTLDSYIRSL